VPLPDQGSSSAWGASAAARSATAQDADVLFVHDPVDGADEGAAQAQALEVVKDLIRLLGLRGPDPNLDIDADLRPEGKNGPLVRSSPPTASTTTAGR
jgi:glutamate-ammonia-ligase adenylyltransferase